MVKLLPFNFLEQEFAKRCRSLQKSGDSQETAVVSMEAAGDAAPVSQVNSLHGEWYSTALFVDPGQENEKLI